MKILIVDDHQSARQMLRLFLHDLISELHECADGAEALPIYAAFLPDWVLMDWEMREMDGLTATRAILGEFPQANVLLITQFDDSELRLSAVEAGAAGFFLKDDLHALRSRLIA